MADEGFEQTFDEPLTEAQWLAWYEAEMRKGWQDDIYIPSFRFDQEDSNDG